MWFCHPGDPVEIGGCIMNKKELIETMKVSIHNGLGGNGWAYSNYGNNELYSHGPDLRRASEAALQAIHDVGFVVVQKTTYDKAYEFVDGHSEEWYISGQELLTEMRGELDGDMC